MANIKKIVRTEEFRIRMSKEEKELFFKFAENMGISPSKLARNLIMKQANSNTENALLLPLVKTYKSYLKITSQDEFLKEIEEGE